MAKQEKTSKSSFVIKLSSETVQKLAEEEQQLKNNDDVSATSENKLKEVQQHATDSVQNASSPKEENNSVTSVVTKDDEKNFQIEISPEDIQRDISDENKSEKTGDSSKDSTNSAWGEYAPYITYEDDKAIYTDPTTQQKYIWNDSTNSWVPNTDQNDVPGRVYSYEDDVHTYTEPDGSKFFWDVEKKAWIPKVDDDFLAFYQMSYGFVDNTSKEQKEKDALVQKDKTKKLDQQGVKRKNEPQWFEPSEETNTKVYVSNLPLDLNEEEFVNLMQKCGLVERDLATHKMKVKLYMDKEHNCFKGDALCTYIKVESVDLALKLLDGYDYKGHKIKVEKAHFQLKGEYNPALKPKKKKKKELEKIKKMQQKLFDWRPEKFIGERSKHERVVIVKNLFHPTDFDKDVQLILDYQQDLREECSKCGEVRKVVIYDRHPEGVAQITMKEPEQADGVVQLINGRWFGKRQIIAEIWDGRTKYRIAETDADISKRIDKWDKFLEGKEDEKNKEKKINENDTGASKESIVNEATNNEQTKIDEPKQKNNEK